MTDLQTPAEMLVAALCGRFAQFTPKSVHYTASEYAEHKEGIDAAAAVAGYHLAGFHRKTKEAVFSSKVPK